MGQYWDLGQDQMGTALGPNQDWGCLVLNPSAQLSVKVWHCTVLGVQDKASSYPAALIGGWG